MKVRNLWWNSGLFLSLLPLAGGCLRQAEIPLEQPAVTQSELKDAPPGQPPEDQVETVAWSPSATDPAEAAVEPVTTEAPVPLNLHPSGPVNEIIKLANAGVEEGVLLSFVTNSTSTFNLGAEEIIYLNDIGVPNSVVAAMMQRDQVLGELASQQALSAAPALQAAPNAAMVPPYAAPPPSQQVAPQPLPSAEYASEPGLVAPAPIEGADPGFYDALSPYGAWVDVEGYGRCWQPTVVTLNPTWQPYFDSGRWIYTDCGWYWLSDYSWGWAPFHYGRWFRHNRLGWCWMPDHVWGPSWVSWRYSDDYCGWAPLPPYATFNTGIGLCYQGHGVAFDFDFGLGIDCFAFVPFRNFCDHHLYYHAVPRHEIARVYNKTTVVTRIVSDKRTVINNGIAADRVARATRSELHKVAIRDASNPNPARGIRPDRLAVDGKTLTVYRPNLRAPVSEPRLAGGTRTEPQKPAALLQRSAVPAPNRVPGQIAERTTVPSDFNALMRAPRGEVQSEKSTMQTPPAGSLSGNGRTQPQTYSSIPRTPNHEATDSRLTGKPDPAPRYQRPWPGSGPNTSPSASAPQVPNPPRYGRPGPPVQATVPRNANHNPQMSTSPTLRGQNPPPPAWLPRPETPASRQAAIPNYQAPVRTAEVPRYAPVPSQGPRYEAAPARSVAPGYSAPAPSFRAAPSTPAPSPAPAASPHSSGAPTSFGNSGKNGR